MSTKLGSLLSRLFVAEYNCIVCGGELHRPNRYRLCGACYGMRFEVLREKACLKCGKMLLAEEEYCLDCQNHEKHFDRAISAVTYTEAAVSLVTALKFRGKKYLADPMARWMTDRFLELEVAADLVIPVPLHPNRRKERGYNQSELLAEVIAESLSLPLDTESVVREKDTLASSGLEGGRQAREENMKDAFRLVSREKVEGKTILLVDDVITTGTTSSFLAEVLKKGGAKRVYVVTFASTREKPPIQEGY